MKCEVVIWLCPGSLQEMRIWVATLQLHISEWESAHIGRDGERRKHNECTMQGGEWLEKKRCGCLDAVYISRLGNSCNFFFFSFYNVQIKLVLCTKTQIMKCLGRITDLIPRRPPQSKLVLSIDGSSCTLCAGHLCDLSGMFQIPNSRIHQIKFSPF